MLKILNRPASGTDYDSQASALHQCNHRISECLAVSIRGSDNSKLSKLNVFKSAGSGAALVY